MKKSILLLSITFFFANSYSQKIYQCGAFTKQRLRTSTITITGKLIDKYLNNGFNWFTVMENENIYKILVISKEQFSNGKIHSFLTLKGCSKISTLKWKQKNNLPFTKQYNAVAR